MFSVSRLIRRLVGPVRQARRRADKIELQRWNEATRDASSRFR